MAEDQTEKIEWDIEDMKRAFIDNAKDYDKIMKQQKKEEEEDE